MNNSYYILAKEAIHIERLHICTWEFTNADSYIEFGMEFSYGSFTNDTLNIWLSVPFIKGNDEVKCLLENLSNRANSRFIFNDIVSGISNIGADHRDGSILQFEKRDSLTILPCRIDVSSGFLKFTLNRPNRYEGNLYFRVLVKHNGTIHNLFCLHSVPDDFEFSFIDSSKLKNIRKLETEAFKKYLPDVKDIGKDCYNIMFLKDCGKESYSLFTTCSEETIGTKQISLAIATNILCSLLFFVYSVRTGIKKGEVWYIQMPWEGIIALFVLIVLCLYLFHIKRKK